MSRRFARAGWPRASAVAQATITASATPHTEGAYTTILASAAQNVMGMLLRGNAVVNQTAVDTSMLLTVAIGAAASEVDVVPNLVFGGYGGGLYQWLPLHVPAGTRVSAKLRAEQVSDTFDAQICFLYGGQMPGWGGYATCETYGADTANSKGTNLAAAAGVYTEIVASTTNPLRAITISAGLVDATANAIIHTVDVGVGTAGSEVVIGTWVYETTIAEVCILRAGPPFMEVPIPAGSRLAMKKDSTSSDDLSAVIHGWR